MTFEFHPDAESEFIASIAYYEECQEDLGLDFAREIYEAIQSIIINPEIWPFINNNIRRRLVNRFPFAVLYSSEGSKIYILAVMHLKRKPDYWISRIQ